ncbi:hypothetical protein ACTJKN_02670 [Pedobacter sp. 22163]|uniref:hypothetical protein n=1 Tax=Pedobacter sp. 22163 TaxID=3453883 RepID=UPI003F831475
MIIIKALKIEAKTKNGEYGSFQEFKQGLNIIAANNSSGKSTLLQSILYSLGLEELLGGRNEKAMQSVLKDFIEVGNEMIRVNESTVFCELSNGQETITLKRHIISQNKSNKLISVFNGSLLLQENGRADFDERLMYVHDAGSAMDVNFGFHMFLENFLGWQVPEVHSTVDDSEKKLYLQTIFASFIIEQKKGWSNFLATIPYFGIKSVEARVIEFILKLDSFQIENKKAKLKQNEKDLETKWFLNWEIFKSLINRGSISSTSIQDTPHDIKSSEQVTLYYPTPDENIEFTEYLKRLLEKYNEIKDIDVKTSGNLTNQRQNELSILTEKLNRSIFASDQLNLEIFNERKKLELLKNQLLQIENDLSKNESVAKISRLGGIVSLDIAKGICATCHQAVSDSLLPQDLLQKPMLIEDNIEYLKSQRQMVNAFIKSNRDYLLDIEDKNTKFLRQISDLRSEIKSIKKELITDDRIPSVSQIETRMELRKQLEFYYKLKAEIDQQIVKIMEIGAEWTDTRRQLKDLPKNSFSVEDEKKLDFLTAEVKRLLNKYNYSSKPTNEVKISRDKFIPTINNYNIAFDSSASDLIRSIWAYTCALYSTSEKFNGNHPKLLIFDEPGQHSMSDKDLEIFFKELATYKCQTIVAASFNNDENIFKSTTLGLRYNLITFDGKLIKKLSGDQSSAVA